MAILLFFIAHWYLSLFFQTFFQHRYAAHAAFTMSKGWEKVFFVLTFIFQGSSYLSTRAYAIMHRMHHAYADTDKDPHSPSFQTNIWSMMWHTYTVYAGISNRNNPVEARFTKNVPDWPAFDKFAGSVIPRVAWSLLYFAFYLKFATSPWLYLLLPLQILMSPVHGAVVNWFAHKYGYKNFWMKNTAENLLRVDILMLGESYHNNHHKRPSSVNFGYRWHELDPVYPIILLLNKLGVIHIPKAKPYAAVKSQHTLNAEHVNELEEEVQEY
jgi:stearoyl-CoA desaturase (delta-9 desaturase)